MRTPEPTCCAIWLCWPIHTHTPAPQPAPSEWRLQWRSFQQGPTQAATAHETIECVVILYLIYFVVFFFIIMINVWLWAYVLYAIRLCKQIIHSRVSSG
jgi:hypothetical protein